MLLTVAGMVMAWMESPAWQLNLATSLPVVALPPSAEEPVNCTRWNGRPLRFCPAGGLERRAAGE